jgi:acyl-CoA synthetase (AMP-forming)/AMP-acid ligase II
MRLIDYLDKGASLGPDKPCLTADGKDWSYLEVQRLSYRAARALDRSGVAPGAKVAVLSSNDPIAFSLVFAISRAGCVWAPINPRNEAGENQFILDNFDCEVLFFASAFAPMVAKMRAGLPKVRLFVCLDGEAADALTLDAWMAGVADDVFERVPPDDLAMLPGTGGTTGQPKGVMLYGANLEAMTAITLMSYPFEGRPAYLAFAPLTHAAGVLCFPILCLGGRIVIMHHADIGEFLSLIPKYGITHAFLPPTVIYMILDHPKLAATDLSSLQCFWYGAAPISAVRLEEALRRIGPMAQLFGQTEAPMMVSTLAPRDHYRPDGSIATERLSSAGKPSPLVQVAIVSKEGEFLPRGERGEIVVRGSLVMRGYYKNAAATKEATVAGFHRTGDIGYLDDDNFLYIVDRAKDMIITGGFNVYSAEVENAAQAFEAVQDCAVIGLPDPKWGERVVAVIQPRAGRTVDPVALTEFVKSRIGSVKAPKQVEIWADLPRSKVGKVLKSEIRKVLMENAKG